MSVQGKVVDNDSSLVAGVKVRHVVRHSLKFYFVLFMVLFFSFSHDYSLPGMETAKLLTANENRGC